MSDIVKASKQSELVRSVADSSAMSGMRVGDVYIDREGSYHRIDSMEMDKWIDWKATEKEWKKKNEGRYFDHSKVKEKEYVYVDDVKVKYSTNGGRYGHGWDDFKSRDTKLLLQNESTFKDWVKVTETTEKYKQIAQDIIEGKADLPSMETEMGEDQLDSSSGLIHVSSKEYLFTMQKAAEEKGAHMKAIQHHVQREMEIKKAHLRGIVSHFQNMVMAFEKKVAKIQRLIHVIELYLGIDETILHFQEGPKAHENEPLCFRQRVMFMDEEVGDPRLDEYGDNKGLDFRNIEAFDSWLCAHENYKKVIPEQKCVCIFKVRRESKHHSRYYKNPFVSGSMEDADKKTYILIRNGDNLYRIWADMEVADRFFPHKKEIMELQKAVIEREKTGYNSDDQKQKLETEVEKYQRQFIMLQGLIDRTDILQPLKEPIKLATMDLKKTKMVRFIYDDGPQLAHAGHVPFKEWMANVNSTIEEGTRIVLTDGAEREQERFDQRFYSYEKDSKYHLPKTPNKGLYTVFLKKAPENRDYANPKGYGGRVTEILTIRYNPQDEVINKWSRYDQGHERKNNISYNITKEDDFLINFDGVTVKDIDYYLDSRLDRREYIVMMPILWEVREQKHKEDEEEHDFLMMVIAPMMAKHPQEELLAAAKEEMVWWKLKNKWKRGLTKDDAKAFRMIGKKLKTRFK